MGKQKYALGLLVVALMLLISCNPNSNKIKDIKSSDIKVDGLYTFFSASESTGNQSKGFDKSFFGINNDEKISKLIFEDSAGNIYPIQSLEKLSDRYLVIMLRNDEMGHDAIFVNSQRAIWTELFIVDTIEREIFDCRDSVKENIGGVGFATDRQVYHTDKGFIFCCGESGSFSCVCLDTVTRKISYLTNSTYDGHLVSFYASKSGHLLTRIIDHNNFIYKFFPANGAAPIIYDTHPLFMKLDECFIGSSSADYVIDLETKTKYVFTNEGIREEVFDYEGIIYGRPISVNSGLYYDMLDGHIAYYLAASNEVVVVDIMEGETICTRYSLPSSFILDDNDEAIYIPGKLIYQSKEGLYQLNIQNSEITTIADENKNIIEWTSCGEDCIIYTTFDEITNLNQSYIWDTNTEKAVELNMSFTEISDVIWFKRGKLQ